jgi:hypothetical protein
MNTTTSSNTPADAPAPRAPLDAGAAALFASAAVVLALILVQLSSVVGGAPANAQGVDRDSGVVTTTARASTDSAVLLVLDQRDERLYVYELENGRRLNLVDGEDLAELFASGSRSGRGR